MAEKACHVFGSPTRFGLTQVIGATGDLMDKRLAQKLGQLLADHERSPHSYVSERWSLKGEKLSGFHQWADDIPALGAYLLSPPLRDPFWLVLVDWKSNGDFYCVLFPKSRSGPLAEIHKQVDFPTGIFLSWKYRPSLHDGKNEKRRAYFEQAFGSLDVLLQIPSILDEIESFIEDAAYLIECRTKADSLAEQSPSQRDGFPEGRLVERRHLARERNPAIIKLAKDQALNNSGRLLCACCGFDFERTYGELGSGFIEAHHTKPLSSLTTDEVVTTVEDLALVCSNCHRMLHRRRPWLGLDQLQEILGGG